MKTEQSSPAFKHRLQFLIMLPLLVCPFLSMLFWALGGGKGSDLKAEAGGHLSGINTRLPDAYFKKGKEKDKLGLYELASRDSMKFREEIGKDPYYKADSTEAGTKEKAGTPELETIFQHAADGRQTLPDSLGLKPIEAKQEAFGPEKEVMEKLAKLKSLINEKPTTTAVALNSKPDRKAVFEPDYSYGKSTELSRLEAAMAEAKHTPGSDPEMERLNGMLDKIMAIQHPEKVSDGSRKNGEAPQGIYEVRTASGQNAITAIIPEKQTLISGATIRLRLAEPVMVDSFLIPSDQFLYGMASLSNERLKVEVHSLRAGNNILPVNLEVYDLDGMEGIYVPGSIDRDVSKQSLDQGINGIGLTTLDPSIGAQATSAGIQAAKNLLSRKVRLVRVTVPDGYQVLLKEAR